MTIIALFLKVCDCFFVANHFYFILLIKLIYTQSNDPNVFFFRINSNNPRLSCSIGLREGGQL